MSHLLEYLVEREINSVQYNDINITKDGQKTIKPADMANEASEPALDNVP